MTVIPDSEIKDLEKHKFLLDEDGNVAVRVTKVEGASATTAITIYNVTLTLANTEYSQLLSNNTKGVRFRCRTAYDVRYAWVTGKVAASVAPFNTLPAGMDYFADEINLDAKTLYLASSQAGVVVEIEEYK